MGAGRRWALWRRLVEPPVRADARTREFGPGGGAVVAIELRPVTRDSPDHCLGESSGVGGRVRISGTPNNSANAR